MSVACEVTEVLKREKVASVVLQSTRLIEDEQSTRPTVEVVVQRGELAHLVSDFRRRRVACNPCTDMYRYALSFASRIFSMLYSYSDGAFAFEVGPSAQWI